MDKEMEKKRPRGQKGKPTRDGTTGNPPDIARHSKSVPEQSAHFDTAEFTARVARKAYELFVRRGDETGSDVEDWVTAEQLVKDEIARANS